MKAAIFFLFAICSAYTGTAQQQAFSNVSFEQSHHREMILFTSQHDVNVRHYRIEASNDGVHFDVIATIPSKSNSMLAVSYKYDITVYPYTHYRIGKVEMNGQLPYSAIVSKPIPAQRNENREPVSSSSNSFASH